MTLDNSAGLAGAGRRLDIVQAKLDKAVRAARARNAFALILALISLVLIGYWLYVAYREFTSFGAEEVTRYGQSQLVEQMPAAATELKRSLREQAPSVISSGEQRLREMPDKFAWTLQEQLGKQLKERSPEAEERLYTALHDGIAEADKHLQEAGGQGNDEAKFKAMLDVLAHVYGTETSKLIDQLHGNFKDGSADLVAHLDRLAEGKDLTAQEQSQRTMIRNFLILAREYHENSAGGTATRDVTSRPTSGPTTTASKTVEEANQPKPASP